VDFDVDPDAHKLYLEGQKRFPFLHGPKTAVNMEYLELLRLQGSNQTKMQTTKSGWISESTWKLIKL
jgi:hypothetical protein